MTGSRHSGFDLAEFRRRLAAAGGGRPWSSLEELLDEEEFSRWLNAEFPSAVGVLSSGDRRTFLRLMGASLVMAGLAGCGESRSDLALPYVNQPENALPGVPRLYATAVELAGYAQPVLATCHDGRPTKLEGNPTHPAVRGSGSDVFMQAAVLQLYDPDRSKIPLRDGQPTTWDAFASELDGLRRVWSTANGRGLHIVTASIGSPTLGRQLAALRKSLPEARFYVFEPTASARGAAGLRGVFGRDVEAHYALESCDVIVSLGADLLGHGPHQVRHAQGMAARRGEVAPGQGRVRLHVAECTPSLTGIAASTRLAVDPPRLAALAGTLAARLGLDGVAVADLTRPESDWVETAARELNQRPGRSLLACGSELPPGVQALAPWANEKLQNVGKTVRYTEPVASLASPGAGLGDLAREMAADEVDTLVVLDSNPVYAAPGALGFGELLKRVPHRIHAGIYRDETAALSTWHLPLSHPLESWGDARAVDGTATILQPLVNPLYSSRSMPQLIAMLGGETDPPADAAVRETWKARFGGDFESRWRQSLHDGFVEATAAPPLTVGARRPDTSALAIEPPAGDAVSILFQPDPCVWDGRFSNVAWLQELPKPTSKITWDCPIAVSPSLAHGLGLANGDFVAVSVGERSVTGPAWITPGQAPRSVVLYLGYGREQGGQNAAGIGYSAYAVMPADGAWHASGTIRRAAGRRSFATTQMHHRMDGFDLVREVTPANPGLPPAQKPTSLYPDWPNPDYAWAMAIDLDRCIGCNACIMACNVENNVAVVGREQVEMGREMLWLRVDHYYSGDVENPRCSFQPVPCMHCEKAPCEMGCPVNATVHSGEGINQMVYNRCIGTRTCSSYCPYKVRRFNWYDYRRFDAATQASHNPDVTVRSRGVMEKCTYCTQRVQAAHVAADKEGRKIRDGEIMTACQQACPTTAIVFGNSKDPQAAVSRLRASGRNYGLLEELGTRPRTTYLARWNDEPGRNGGGS